VVEKKARERQNEKRKDFYGFPNNALLDAAKVLFTN
jgi:hypothetical protein